MTRAFRSPNTPLTQGAGTKPGKRYASLRCSRLRRLGIRGVCPDSVCLSDRRRPPQERAKRSSSPDFYPLKSAKTHTYFADVPDPVVLELTVRRDAASTGGRKKLAVVFSSWLPH